MSLTDKNLFAYCDNNPVMRVDEDGEFWGMIATFAIKAIACVCVSVVTSYVASKAVGDDYTTEDIVADVITGISGALGNDIITASVSAVTAMQKKSAEGGTLSEIIIDGGVSAFLSVATVGSFSKMLGSELDVAAKAFSEFVFGFGSNLIYSSIEKGFLRSYEKSDKKHYRYFDEKWSYECFTVCW